MNWLLKKFDDLTPHELYAILQLRNEVFAVEQNCVYRDMDDKDQPSYHLMGLFNNKLVAYTRLIPPGIIYNEPSIGRVVTSPSIRREGLGKVLMNQSMDELYRLFGKQSIKIGAQCYLQKFYTDLGFVPCGDMYLEDGIEHIQMIKS
jgi:ElaA protein